MGIEDVAIARRLEAQGNGEQVVPDSYQGVTKQRVIDVLAVIDRCTDNMVDVVYSLLCDEPSWYKKAALNGYRFCDGASVAHIGTHVGILQRGGNLKLDREGRDYWLKPLWEIGAIEKVYFDSNADDFKPGHPIAKSSNSAYRLAADLMVILQAPNTQWRNLAEGWLQVDVQRERLALQAAQALATANTVESAHSRLIRASYEVYATRFLPGYQVIYIDDGDGDRISQEQKDVLADAEVTITIHDSMPDVLLWNRQNNYLWVIEAVTSDGEVDIHKMRSMEEFALRNGKDGIGFTTTYPTWKKAAERQAALKNLAGNSYLWILEDPSRNIQIHQEI
ncbi:BsuBI/PstI family type II restriction endonuclease [Serratia fonticola]|uniref:BsuBI/PstI family type II restriction endonuclease n=1 Tax=Serratia fonticola TaxID=47917 RepID=UPI00217B31D8|nr:BsuBI/PstI family type II restriction endonuclease [Serratia fonticola]CAI0803006.1 BsuBI/PstI restriction endonuclease C-terminus [Serratia fonticola]